MPKEIKLTKVQKRQIVIKKKLEGVAENSKEYQQIINEEFEKIKNYWSHKEIPSRCIHTYNLYDYL
ncbi:MAG: hypothetical protein FWC41_04335 [Firmicutes bacterium]|nr:hypothetical protein [Bacillota bacterium]